MTYRELPADEWTKLHDTFADFGVAMPHPSMARIVVAEDAGRIVGFLALQHYAHLEPLYIAPEYRGKVSWKRLMKMLNPARAFVTVANPVVERMAQLVGMKEVPFKVYRQET